MTNSNRQDLYSDIMPQIGPDSIRSSIDMLRLFAAKGASPAIMAEIEELEQRYFYMLRYIASGHMVPRITTELMVMVETARNICTQIERARVAREEQTLYAAQLRYQDLRPEENLQSIVSDYLAELERLRTDSASLTDSRRTAALEQLASDIFMRLWVEAPMNAEIVELMMSILKDSDIPLHDRELWLGAIGLGLQVYDDLDRRQLLNNVVAQTPDQLSAIASVWLVLAVAVHDGDTSHLNSSLGHINAFFPQDLADVYTELFRACGTKELSDDLARDILPGVMDIGRRMADKFGNDPAKIEEAMRNGEWDDGIDASGFEKIKGFIEAQNQGDDVYMGTLGKMRSFPFFNNIPNWFLPFYTGHSALADVTDGEGLAFADTVGKMPFLCDSDKYALLLSLASAPAPMRENLLRNLVDQQRAMNGEMLEAALAEAGAEGRRAYMSRYIKNLYRFFTLFRRKSEFPAVFDIDMLFGSFPVETLLAEGTSDVASIAELLLRRRHYRQAASLFHFIASEDPENVQPYQKMGFAHELDGNLDMAEVAYVNALGLKPGDMWTVRRLAIVLSRTGKYDDIIELLEPLQGTIADDRELLAIYAEAAYHTGDFARALELYYNIAYLDGGDAVKPRLAWLLVLNGDFDAAEATFADFIENSADPADFMHLGHMHWAKNEISQALDAYARAGALMSPRKESFDELFADSFAAVMNRLSIEQAGALRTVPDIIAFRTYGSRLGKL